jgi:hypothetical protein
VKRKSHRRDNQIKPTTQRPSYGRSEARCFGPVAIQALALSFILVVKAEWHGGFVVEYSPVALLLYLPANEVCCGFESF